MKLNKLAPLTRIITIIFLVISFFGCKPEADKTDNPTSTLSPPITTHPIALPSFLNGVDSNYYNTLIKSPYSNIYTHNGAQVTDYFALLKEVGVNSMRVRLFTKDTGDGGLQEATELARGAHQHGLNVMLSIFLSDDWGSTNDQPSSSLWSNLLPDVEKVAVEVEKYTHKIAQHFYDNNIPIAVYSIGNEINFGISGFHPVGKTDAEYAQEKTNFPELARLVSAGQTGVKSVDPKAKFMHHLSYFDPQFLKDHFQYMIDNGVQIDFLGLSYYASGGSGGLGLDVFQDEMDKLYMAFNRPVLIPEYAYTANEITDEDAWKVTISTMLQADPYVEDTPENVDTMFMLSMLFNSPIADYPGTPKGQANFIRDFLTWSKDSKTMKGAFYWSPEGSSIKPFWANMSLFDEFNESRPGLHALTSGGE